MIMGGDEDVNRFVNHGEVHTDGAHSNYGLPSHSEYQNARDVENLSNAAGDGEENKLTAYGSANAAGYGDTSNSDGYADAPRKY